MPIDVNCSAWKGFRTGEWRHLVNVRNFIQKNYTPTPVTRAFWPQRPNALRRFGTSPMN